jgi:hypothetical protein
MLRSFLPFVVGAMSTPTTPLPHKGQGPIPLLARRPPALPGVIAACIHA